MTLTALTLPSDNAVTWSILLHPNDPNVLYAGTQDQGIFRTSNGGKSWDELNVPEPAASAAWASQAAPSGCASTQAIQMKFMLVSRSAASSAVSTPVRLGRTLAAAFRLGAARTSQESDRQRHQD